MSISIDLKGCQVRVYPIQEKLETIFADGTRVLARPNWGDPDSVQRAHDLGYKGDCWHMSRDHEILHTLASMAMGEPHSPTLWAVAHKVQTEKKVKHDEEQVVFSLQRLLMLGTRDEWLQRLPDPDAVIESYRGILQLIRQDRWGTVILSEVRADEP